MVVATTTISKMQLVYTSKVDVTELSPLKTWEEGGEGGKGWFSWTKVYYYSLLPGSFLLETNATRGCCSGSICRWSCI